MFKKAKYLKKGRLADIIALISTLSLDVSDSISFEEISKKIFVKPNSSKSWEELASQHPEFFLVSDGKIYLTFRRYKSNVLEIDQVISLIQSATSIHDRELYRKNKNSYLVPLWIAILSIAFSLFTLYYKNTKMKEVIIETIRTELNVKNSK